MKVYKQFTFDAAHCLPHLPEGHKCRNPHGHTYRVEVQVEASSRYLERNGGMVLDYSAISSVWKNAVEPLVDHSDLNGVIKPYSTCEYLAIYLWEQFKKQGIPLSKIRVGETSTAGVEYEGE